MRPAKNMERDASGPPKATSRRRVLKAIGATGAAAAAIVAGATAGGAQGLPTLRIPGAQRFVYRLMTRGHRACKACKIHHRYVVGATAKALDAQRAHPGCNCPIVKQLVTSGEFGRLFPRGIGTADLRKLP